MAHADSGLSPLHSPHLYPYTPWKVSYRTVIGLRKHNRIRRATYTVNSIKPVYYVIRKLEVCDIRIKTIIIGICPMKEVWRQQITITIFLPVTNYRNPLMFGNVVYCILDCSSVV